MSKLPTSRRQFLKLAGVASAGLLRPRTAILGAALVGGAESQAPEPPADYTLRIANTPIELAPNRIVSAITYNGQFPGPLLRFKEGQQAVVDVYNDTDAPEQLHWHGQFLSTDVDGAAEEGTPYIPAHGKRRIAFTPRPAGFRFYHTHNRAGADLHAGQYSGQVGPVYIEPRHEPGNYDREVFLVLKEFEPSFSQGGDMAMDFLAPATKVKELETSGESAMKASLAKGMPHGYEVGYRYFTINGRMSGHGEPVRVQTRRARALPRFEWQRHGDSQPGAARTHLSGRGARWQPRAHSCRRSRALARNCGENLCHRRNGSSGRVADG